MSSSSTSAAAQSTATESLAEGTEIEMPSDALLMREKVEQLFQKHRERTEILKRSRQLNEEMRELKGVCDEWLFKQQTEKFSMKEYGRQLKKVQRKVKKKVTRQEIYDWIEDNTNEHVRKALEKHVEEEEKKVEPGKIEYRITYCGIRKRGESVVGTAQAGKKRKP